MKEKNLLRNLLVRIYDVGFGDCIFVRVPDKDRLYNILIDFGSSGPAMPRLKKILNNIHTLLKYNETVNPIDLLVVTHPHQDHIKGFEAGWFKDIKVRRIMFSAFMKDDHPQAEESHKFTLLAEKAAKSFELSIQKRGLHLSKELDILLKNNVCNETALENLKEIIPDRNGIEPIYVARDLAEHGKELISDKQKSPEIQFDKGTTCLKEFKEKDTCLRVLAPEWDIDTWYLGKEPEDYRNMDFKNGKTEQSVENGGKKGEKDQPENISEMEFRILKNRLYYSTFAFAKADRDLKNNTSVVLLLEWRGRRLLFTGDAEWKGKPVKEYSSNGCWDIMLSNKDVRHHLEKIDFLKVGHHGSINGTPFEREGGSQEMLKMILPLERKNMAKAVVSTLSGAKDKIIEIPYPPLMDELGKRICNAKKYVHSNRPLLLQPERTDCCSNEKFWIDVEIEPDKKWNK